MLLVFVSLNNLWSPASQAGETCAKIHIFSVSTGIQHLVFFLLRRIFFSHAPLAYIHPQPCVAIHVMKPPRPPAYILPQPSVAIRVMKPPRPPADSNSNYVGFKHGFLVAFYAISCRRKNLFALKGQKRLAQGRAKRHPGLAASHRVYALKGRGKRIALTNPECCSALPWACVLLPLQGVDLCTHYQHPYINIALRSCTNCSDRALGSAFG